MILRTALSLLILFAVELNAEPGDEAWEAYLAGDFNRVEQLVINSKTDANLDSTQRARLYLALGCADALRGRDATAEKAFENALSFNPHLKLSASDLPPPVWKLFQPIKDRFALKPSYLLPDKIPKDTVRIVEFKFDTTYIPEPHFRSSSVTLKSLIFPGWGHLAEGRRRGYLFAGVEAIVVSGLIISVVETSRTRENYLSARDPVEMKDKYDAYNRSYQITWGLVFLAVTNYLVAQIDFFTAPPPVHLSLYGSPTCQSTINLDQRVGICLTIKL